MKIWSRRSAHTASEAEADRYYNALFDCFEEIAERVIAGS
jgi:hypothetical protein